MQRGEGDRNAGERPHMQVQTNTMKGTAVPTGRLHAVQLQHAGKGLTRPSWADTRQAPREFLPWNADVSIARAPNGQSASKPGRQRSLGIRQLPFLSKIRQAGLPPPDASMDFARTMASNVMVA